MSAITVIARSKARAGCEPKLEQAIKEAVGPTHAEEGCLKYSFQRSIEDPSRYVIIEKWTSKEALDKHLTTPHIQTLFKQLPELVAEAPEIHVFKSLSVGLADKADI